MSGSRVLVEGRPGVGKTTLVQGVVTRLQRAGHTVCGFTTGEIRVAGRRVGFEVQPIGGIAEVLAHVDLPGPLRVGRYGVDLATFERVSLASVREPGALVVIDELGKMELASLRFAEAAHNLLSGTRPVLASVHAVRHPVTDRLKQLPDIELIRVTVSNRNRLVDQLSERLLSSLGDPGLAE
jgi:nucleoside-triphosphatase